MNKDGRLSRERAKRFYDELVNYLGGNVWQCENGSVEFDERVYYSMPMFLVAYDTDGNRLSSNNNKALRDELRIRFYEWLKDFKSSKMI